MKTLTDEIAEILPEMLAASPDGIPIAVLAMRIGASVANVRRACTADDGKATLIRKSNRLLVRLVGVGFAAGDRICCICRCIYRAPSTSKRVTCTRRCAASLSWQGDEHRAAKIAGIRRAKCTPEAAERTRQSNRERWARPGEREKLAERNRQMWQDPHTRATLSVAISVAHSTPESRAKVSRRMKARWDDPAGRDKLEAGIRRSKSAPEQRAKFSKLLKERWQDPQWVEKWRKGFRRAQADPDRRRRASENSKARWQDPKHRAHMIERIRQGKGTGARKTRTKKATVT